jgi:hypothetical protein
MKKKLYTLDPSETLEDLQDYFFPPYITLAHLFHAPPAWSLRPRVLRQYQLQYVLEGRADYGIGELTTSFNASHVLADGPGNPPSSLCAEQEARDTEP